MEDTEILINHEQQTVTIKADLRAFNKDKPHLLDRYDYDHDPERGEPWSTLTDYIHENVPYGSTSFDIYTFPKSISKYKRTYTFEAFLRDE